MPSKHIEEKRTTVDTNIVYDDMEWIKVCDLKSLSNEDLIVPCFPTFII